MSKTSEHTQISSYPLVIYDLWWTVNRMIAPGKEQKLKCQVDKLVEILPKISRSALTSAFGLCFMSVIIPLWMTNDNSHGMKLKNRPEPTSTLAT